MNKIGRLLGRISFLKKYSSYLNNYSLLKKKRLLWIFLLSLLRYSIFLAQYIILLKLFKVEIGLTEGIISICLSYFLMLFIPFFAISEISIRGSAAIIFIGLFSAETMGILSASISLWIINIAIPAIIGTIILNKEKI